MKNVLCVCLFLLLAGQLMAQKFEPKQPWAETRETTSSTGTGYIGNVARIWADITGDGKADFVYVSRDQILVCSSDGTQLGPKVDFTPKSPDGRRFEVTFFPMFADVNGDKKVDLIMEDYGQMVVYTSTGTEFAPGVSWGRLISEARSMERAYIIRQMTESDKRTQMADVNGDGKADYIYLGDKGTYVCLSTGSGFGPEKLWNTGAAITETKIIPAQKTASATISAHSVPDWKNIQLYHFLFADVTGDKKADFVTVVNGKISVRRSTGKAFEAEQVWASIFFHNVWHTFLADANGDGKADIIIPTNRGLAVHCSTGKAFKDEELWIKDSFIINPSYIFFADVNGDAKVDPIVVENNTYQYVVSRSK